MSIGSIGIAMVRNEEDIIEAFIRHNLHYLDGLAIINNGSTDSTGDILRAMMRDAFPVFVIDDSVLGYFQSEKMSILLHRVCRTFFPDFVFPLDADEFIQAESKESFLGAIAMIPTPGISYLPWVTYVPDPAANDMMVFPQQFTFRRKLEQPQYFKVILRTGDSLHADVILTQGSHDVRSKSSGFRKAQLNNIHLAHFPVRSKDQIACKVLLGWLAVLAKDRTAASRQESYQWREIYEKLLRNDEEFDGLALTEMGLNYAQVCKPGEWSEHVIPAVPQVIDAEVRYPGRCDKSLLARVVKAWERQIIPESASISEQELQPLHQRAASNEKLNHGVFEADWHIKNLFIDVQPFRYLYDRLGPRSVIDVGCGVGQYPHLFRKFGAEQVFGIDGLRPERSFLADGEYLAHDLTMPLDLHRRFDLVVCLEVAEHMPPGTELHLLDLLDRHAMDYMLFSAAEPGQPGHGHINCRPLPFWENLLRSKGWNPLLFETLAFRAIASFSWLRRNPILLTRKTVGEKAGRDAWSKLIEVYRRPYRWYGESPAIVHEPLRYHIRQPSVT